MNVTCSGLCVPCCALTVSCSAPLLVLLKLRTTCSGVFPELFRLITISGLAPAELALVAAVLAVPLLDVPVVPVLDVPVVEALEPAVGE